MIFIFDLSLSLKFQLPRNFMDTLKAYFLHRGASITQMHIKYLYVEDLVRKTAV